MWLSAAILLAVQVGFAAYLESDFERLPERAPVIGPRPRPPEPPIIISPPPPHADWGLAGFVKSLSIGSPVTYRNLTVFPLYHPSGGHDRGYLEMEEALRRGDLEIRETGRGIVSELAATNRSGRFILLLAGEILAGGKQNRILRRDVLLAPYSTEVLIPAYCVERGRWTPETGGRFRGTGRLGSLALRRSAADQAAQEQVWEEVERLSGRHGYSSSTGDLSGLYANPKVREGLEAYERRFEHILRTDPVGVVVCTRGRTVAAEFFVDSHLFRAMWPRILSSYTVEVWDSPGRGGLGRDWPGIAEIERFLRRIERASQSPERGAGAGTPLRLSGPGAWGSCLSHRGEPIHTVAYPFPRHAW